MNFYHYLFKEKRRVNIFWKLKAYRKFLRPIKLNFVKNYNFDSNLNKFKNWSFLVEKYHYIVMRRSMIKEHGLWRLKGDTCTKKMRQTRNILVNFVGCSFLLKITEKPYFITLSQHVNLRF